LKLVAIQLGAELGVAPPRGGARIETLIGPPTTHASQVAPPRGGARIETEPARRAQPVRASRPPAGARGLKHVARFYDSDVAGRAPPRGRAD